MQMHCRVHHIWFMSKILVLHFGCHCSKVLLYELKLYFFQCSCRYRVCAHCEGTRLTACDAIFICCFCYTCWHFCYIVISKRANFAVYKIQHCWLWVSLLSEKNISIAIFRYTTRSAGSWIFNPSVKKATFWQSKLCSNVYAKVVPLK